MAAETQETSRVSTGLSSDAKELLDGMADGIEVTLSAQQAGMRRRGIMGRFAAKLAGLDRVLRIQERWDPSGLEATVQRIDEILDADETVSADASSLVRSR